MLSKLPRDYYVHLYLEEVRPDQSIAANVEPEMNVEVRVESSEKPSDDGNVEENIVFKSTYYESDFIDSENDLEDDVVSKGVGDNVTR
ncbi:hypothetical protein V6N11_034017 [Hibiscus sabdariffa]|uniref:Uncharacterized protein n=1 Tax=Hibiscus sabdariffa TaxID=183260 RepID=A0ABR2S1D5_9ROSI